MTQKMKVTLENKSKHIYDYHYLVTVIRYLEDENIEFVFQSENDSELDGFSEREIRIQSALLQRMLLLAKTTNNNVSVTVKSDSFNTPYPTEPLHISYNKEEDFFELGMGNSSEELVFEADILLGVVNSLIF
ncbi:hypothetical protein BACERE00183_04439 [Bacillus cereus]|nr:hypothetical protein BACERE00183_04439 [Bacillus cereus]